MMILFESFRRGVLPVALLASLSAFKVPDDPQPVKARRKATLTVLIRQMVLNHYALKPINVAFSEAVWTNFLSNLDYNKGLFLQEDVDSLKAFRDIIDDEMHENDLGFFEAVLPIYHKRLDEAEQLYKELLSRPFTFTAKEAYQVNRDSLNYPAGDNDRRERWRKYLKYQVLKKMIDLQAQADQQNKTGFHTDTSFESQARLKTLRWLNGYFRSLRKDDDRFENYLNTITFYMDPHTTYMSPISAAVSNAQMTHRYYGLGMLLEDREGDIYIKSVAPGGPAWKSGLPLEGKQILKVSPDNGTMVDISEFTTAEVSHMIQGAQGTSVRLILKEKSGKTDSVSFIRDEIRENADVAKSAILLKGEKKIGYIRLPLFYDDYAHSDGAHCSNDVDAELHKLMAAHVDGLIIDLRDNPGGSLPQVVQMGGLFIPNGPIVQVADKIRRSIYIKDSTDKRLYNLPMAIMVNEGSASASEIFSAAMQDYHRAIIVGAPTYGKGTVQQGMNLIANSDGFDGQNVGSLRLTIQKFFRINGSSTQLKGVTPDILLPDNGTFMKNREKNNYSALPWDHVEKADYQCWPDSPHLSEICPAIMQQVATSPAFNRVRENTLWLRRHESDPISLNIRAYRKQSADLLAHNQQSEQALKLPQAQELKVLGTSVSQTGANGQMDQPATPYQNWLRNIGVDIYVDQTSDIVLDIIH